MLPAFLLAYKNPACTTYHSALPPNFSLTFPLYNVALHSPNTPLSLIFFIISMASTTILNLILSILLSAALITSACGPCEPKPRVPKKGPPAYPFCPRDTLKLGACGDLLGLVNVLVGTPPSGHKCCAVLNGLTDLEVAACLCTVIKANVLGINLNMPVALSALVSSCRKTIPPGFKCV